MVKISITLEGRDQTVSDDLIEAVGKDMANLIENALNKTSNPAIAMAILKEELSGLSKRIILRHEARGMIE